MTNAPEDLASTMLDRLDGVGHDEQVAHRISADDDVPAIRAELRRLARQRQLRIRTGLVGTETLAVIRADATIWTDPTSVMRQKLQP